MQVFARNTHKTIKIPTLKFKKLVREVFKIKDWKVPEQTKELSILFCSDKYIQKLNKNYRKKDKATDVLSFPQSKTPFTTSLGDIVISLDTALKQSEQYKCSLNQEITRLLIHGILHLLGYDHVRIAKSEAQKMRRLEKEILLTLIDKEMV